MMMMVMMIVIMIVMTMVVVVAPLRFAFFFSGPLFAHPSTWHLLSRRPTTFGQASADTICVLTEKRMKLWGNVCSLVASEKTALRRSVLDEAALSREKHGSHWDTRVSGSLSE